jgi:hypothetical protein
MPDTPLLSPSFLFRFEVRLRRSSLAWSPSGLELPETCRLPCFGTVGKEEFSAASPPADVRIAWDTGGLGVSVRVTGKRQLPWCRESRMDESDGLHLLIDTRNSPGIHRANRFCHRFAITPFGGGPRRDQAIAQLLAIARARQEPNPIDPKAISVFGQAIDGGYQLSALLPENALTGFDPLEYPKISLWYVLVDRELGMQSFTLGPGFPCIDDPSLWASASLVE